MNNKSSIPESFVGLNSKVQAVFQCARGTNFVEMKCKTFGVDGTQ
jgi:hypothetical protein